MIAAVFYVLTFISMSTQATPLRLGSSAKIQLTNQYHDDIVPNGFHIRCTPQTQESCAKAIASIQLAKDGKKIVNLHTGDSILYNRLMESSVTAQGHLDDVINKSYLSVTVNEAVKEDSGLYTCKFVYIDENLNYKDDTASVNVTITNQDTQDIIKHLLSKMSLLENLVAFQREEVSSLKTSLVEQGRQHQAKEADLLQKVTSLKTELKVQKNDYATKIEQQKNETKTKDLELQQHISVHKDQLGIQDQDLRQLKEKEAEFLQKVTSLKTELAVQKNDYATKIEQQKNETETKDLELQQQISVHTDQLGIQDQDLRQLKEKVNTTVFFTAWHTRTGSFKTGADMVYDDVVENVGGAYNGSTGKFTAPVDGLYFFDVSVCSDTGKGIIIDLKTSDGRLLTRLYDYDGQYYSYSDTSCVVKLYAGEYVHPVVRYGVTGYRMRYWDTKDPVNKFYGFLIKTL